MSEPTTPLIVDVDTGLPERAIMSCVAGLQQFPAPDGAITVDRDVLIGQEVRRERHRPRRSDERFGDGVLSDDAAAGLGGLTAFHRPIG